MPSDKQNSSWLALQYIFSLLVALATLKMNINHFGNSGFGIWLTLASVWGFGTALDFGFGTAIIKNVAEFKNDYSKTNRILSSSLFIFLITGAMILSVGFIVGKYIFFTNERIIPQESQKLFLINFFILGVSFYFQYMSLFFKSIFDGLNNFLLGSKLTILQNIIILSGVAFISFFKLGLTFLSLIYLVGNLTTLILSVYLFRKKVQHYKLEIGLFDFVEVKNMFRLSISVQAITIFYGLIDPLVKYMLGTYLGTNRVANYEIARRFALAISGLFFNAFRIVLPKTSILKTDDDIHTFVDRDLVKYCKFGVTYSGVTFGVFSLPIILVMYFVFHSYESIIIFLILALPETINNFGYTVYNMLLGIGKSFLLVIVQFTNLITVYLSLLIIFTISHSVAGLIGYFISVIIGNIIMIGFLKLKWGVRISKLMIQSKFYKLFFLLCLMIIALISVQNSLFSIFFVFSILSSLTTIIFFREMIEYFYQLKSLALNKLVGRII
jgi:O-antigen/teichoic acid export membrane protein